MIKDHTRDYVTEMFRVWALHRKSRLDLEGNEGLKLDIEAVDKTFCEFERVGKSYIVKAVKAVYCLLPEYPFTRNVITLRVRRHALEVPCCEKQVYEWLKKARKACARNRGLRL